MRIMTEFVYTQNVTTMQDVPTTVVDVISTRNVLKIFAPAIIIQVSTSEWSYGMYIEFVFYMLSVIKLLFIF